LYLWLAAFGVLLGVGILLTIVEYQSMRQAIVKSPVAETKNSPRTNNACSLTGQWTNAAWIRLQIDDDGTKIVLKLQSSGNTLSALDGTLSRRNDKPDSRVLDGTIQARFFVNPRNAYSITATAILDGPNTLRLQCSNWPVFQGRKLSGRRVYSETFTKQE
jgi:hypothetical protein